jgi:hypothetical protein
LRKDAGGRVSFLIGVVARARTRIPSRRIGGQGGGIARACRRRGSKGSKGWLSLLGCVIERIRSYSRRTDIELLKSGIIISKVTYNK